ncbi:MAG: hypothetical protein HDQ44_01760, partial [Desulfovibrio sp.]|nr:hypothetical protein [Desulfovibrio sp.]
MDTSLPDNIAAFAASLSPRQRAVLLQTLLSGPGISRRHDNRCLETIEQTLWQQACRPASPERGYANGRVWLIYMLLRYGAMRLKEILRLREGDMDFGAGRICAGGRTVLLGPVIAARLAAF